MVGQGTLREALRQRSRRVDIASAQLQPDLRLLHAQPGVGCQPVALDQSSRRLQLIVRLGIAADLRQCFASQQVRLRR